MDARPGDEFARQTRRQNDKTALEFPMRKLLTSAIAALTLGGSLLTTAAPATAASFHGGGFHGGGFHGGGFHGGGFRGGGFRGGGFRGRGFGGGAFFAGAAGLALGAAIASPYYYGPGYGYGYDPYYYGPGYAYGPGYYGCYRGRVWDPRFGRYVPAC
jgi:hypothetical protein